MALTTEDEQLLASLRAAEVEIATGRRVAKVMSGGRTVEYAAADLSRLRGQIETLEALQRNGGRRSSRGFLRITSR